ncbi:MAG TPA: OmpA family protein [Vicinamibacterales bacterium]|nr:OmpA family protein [Vicinamibacterales bacterium]
MVTGIVMTAGLAASLVAQDYRAYQNYDFVAGDKILFEDDFRDAQDGEFPARWKLRKGQAVVNKVDGEPALLLTDGNYAEVEPRIRGNAYLPDTFTIELDFYPKAGGFEKIGVMLTNGDTDHNVFFGSDVNTENTEHDLSASYPGGSDAWDNKWHHLALVYKAGQLKAYEDQSRVLVAPDFGEGFQPKSVYFAGIGETDNPLIFRNVRIAAGGAMNVIQTLTRDGKVVSHILFDVNSSTVKPQSMGAIMDIVKALKSDASLKLEIGGHTDSDGDAAKNLALSESRAAAIKKLMVDQGIDAGRLTTKGYGATKPLAPNNSPENKANNRRVEFTKIA